MTFIPVINMPTVEVVGAFTQGAHPGGFNGQDAYTGHAVPTLAFDSTFGAQSRVFEDMTPPVKVGSGAGIASPPAVMEGGSLAVRRLTPVECERQRLMGWPDDWTRWTADSEEIADSARYRMVGNGVASCVAEWIGRCILDAEAET